MRVPQSLTELLCEMGQKHLPFIGGHGKGLKDREGVPYGSPLQM